VGTDFTADSGNNTPGGDTHTSPAPSAPVALALPGMVPAASFVRKKTPVLGACCSYRLCSTPFLHQNSFSGRCYIFKNIRHCIAILIFYSCFVYKTRSLINPLDQII
jgi:hypothetical protein